MGDSFGDAPRANRRARFAPPTLEAAVIPRDPGSEARCTPRSRSSPSRTRSSTCARTTSAALPYVSLYGEVQQEVIAQTLAADLGIEIEFLETTTICIERVGGVGHAVQRLGQPPNRYLATVGLCVEPGRSRWRSRGDARRRPRDDPSLHLQDRRRVPRLDVRLRPHDASTRPCRDGRCPTVTSHSPSARYDSPSSSARDFRKLTTVVLRMALRDAGTVVCEPIDRFRLDAPADSLSGLLQLLARLRAVPDPPAMRGRVARRSPARSLPRRCRGCGSASRD